jgi:hypothetical protein
VVSCHISSSSPLPRQGGRGGEEGESLEVGKGGAATVAGGAGDEEVCRDSDDVVGGTAEVETVAPICSRYWTSR